MLPTSRIIRSSHHQLIARFLQPFCYKSWANTAQHKTPTRYSFFSFEKESASLIYFGILLRIKKATPSTTSTLKNSFVLRKRLPILLSKRLLFYCYFGKFNRKKKVTPKHLSQKRKLFMLSGLPLCLQCRHNVGSSSRKRNTTTGIQRYNKY